MEITLYQRTYPVDGAPLTLSITPFAARQSYTFPTGDKVYQAVYSEIRIVAPDGTRVERVRDRVTWDGDKGRVRSTAREVFDLASAGSSGFRLAG